MGKNSAITRRTIIPMLAIVLILCLLCGCTPELRAEDGVKSDLSSSSVFQQYFDDEQSITDFIVTKRQTDTDNKADTVWVEVWAENEEKSADLSFIMQYTLYNDGWLLENVAENRESQWEFTPESGPSEDLISSTIPAEATNIEQEDYQGGNTLHISYSMDTDCDYYIKHEDCSQDFYFDTMTGAWTSSERVILTEEKDFEPLIGVWTCDPEYTGEIDSDTGEEIMAGAEFEITNVTLDSDGNPWEAQGEMIVLFQIEKYGEYYQGGYKENLEDMVVTEKEDKLELEQGIGYGWISFQKDEIGELTAKVYWERRNNGYYGVTVGDEEAFILRKDSSASDSDSTTSSTP